MLKRNLSDAAVISASFLFIGSVWAFVWDAHIWTAGLSAAAMLPGFIAVLWHRHISW